MRLICGLLQLDGSPARQSVLDAMIAQMDVPRLRPNIATWLEGPAALAVLDFGATQPGDLPRTAHAVMAADVRLDEAPGFAKSEDARAPAQDTLLLSLIEIRGTSVLSDVLGDFAFACWNERTHTLTCARDTFGIRSFAYVHKPRSLFAFASLPKALYGSGIVSKKIDEDAVARRTVRSLRHDDSLVVGIKRLPPAHILTVSGAGIAIERYWQLDRSNAGSLNIAPDEAAERLGRLVDEAVRSRLPPTGEIGAHLSGGLDSSAIAVLAARDLRTNGRSLHAYSFLDRQRNDIALEDESEFVKAVLDQEPGVAWTPIRPPPAANARILDADTMASADGDDPENAVCAAAEAQRVGIILSGWGGDEAATFNGRGAMAEHLLRGRWRLLGREIRAYAAERKLSLPRAVYGELLSYILPDSLIGTAKRMRGRTPDLRSGFAALLTARAKKQAWSTGLRMTADARENRWRLITSPHIAERAEIWAATGARHGLAFAFPLLDRRVVEFALSLPSELFLRDGFRRRPFRDAMADVLPERVRLRHQKYQPFPGRILDLAERKDELLARIDSYKGNAAVERIVDLQRLRRQVEAFPSPEELRADVRPGENPTPPSEMVTALRVIATADYLAQHGT